MSLSETATRQVGQQRSASDSLAGLVDLASRAAQAFLRGVADALAALADAATKAASGPTGPGTVQVFLADASPAQVFMADALPVRVFLTDLNGASMGNFVGKAIRIANWGGTAGNPVGGFRNSAGALYDPPSPAFRYRLASGITQVISGSGLTHDGTGLYSATLIPTIDGDLVATAVSGDGAFADPVTTKIEPAF